MKTVVFSYKSGSKVVGSELQSQVLQTLKEIRTPLRKRCTNELRQSILDPLRNCGWSDKIRISSKSALTLTAISGKTAMCLQTGNMARFYADLLKLQAQFLDNKISSAIYVLPTKTAAGQIGDNIANYERLIAELSHMFASVITIPLIVIGFAEEIEMEESE